jgi:hypothetical protein
MNVSSSMISTSVAISAAISRPAASARRRVSADVGAEDEGDFSSEKPSSDKQQEGLARQRRDVGQPPLRRQRQRRDVALVVDRHRIPDLGEQPEQARARAVAFVEQRAILQQRFEHGGDIGIAEDWLPVSARA